MKLAIVKILCALSVFSVALYAFTGIALWPDLPDGSEGRVRGALLALLHLLPVVLWSFMDDEL